MPEGSRTDLVSVVERKGTILAILAARDDGVSLSATLWFTRCAAFYGEHAAKSCFALTDRQRLMNPPVSRNREDLCKRPGNIFPMVNAIRGNAQRQGPHGGNR